MERRGEGERKSCEREEKDETEEEVRESRRAQGERRGGAKRK